MREQEAAPSRRRRKSPPKEKAKARKFDIKEIFGELRTAFKIFNIVAALVTLYVIASLYTPWTGDAGAATAGGAYAVRHSICEESGLENTCRQRK